MTDRAMRYYECIDSGIKFRSTRDIRCYGTTKHIHIHMPGGTHFKETEKTEMSLSTKVILQREHENWFRVHFVFDYQTIARACSLAAYGSLCLRLLSSLHPHCIMSFQTDSLISTDTRLHQLVKYRSTRIHLPFQTTKEVVTSRRTMYAFQGHHLWCFSFCSILSEHPIGLWRSKLS